MINIATLSEIKPKLSLTMLFFLLTSKKYEDDKQHMESLKEHFKYDQKSCIKMA